MSSQFRLGQVVWFKTSSEKSGVITGILERISGRVILVTWGHDLQERYHNESELTDEKPLIL